MMGTAARAFPAVLAAMLSQPSLGEVPQARPAPVVTTQTFEAWQMRCETMAGAQPATRCGAVSSITVKSPTGASSVVAVVMARRVPGTDSLQLSMELPNMVWLPPGVVLLDDANRERARLPFVTCEQAACQAGDILSKAGAEELLAAGDALTAVYELKTRQQVKLRFSMKGFSQALSALPPASDRKS